VTTMFDYYGLHNTFPGRKNPVGRTCYAHLLQLDPSLSQIHQ